MTLSQRVEELTETYLNDSKRSIGEFVLREKLRIRECSTQQITEQTDTSKAAVVLLVVLLADVGPGKVLPAVETQGLGKANHYSKL